MPRSFLPRSCLPINAPMYFNVTCHTTDEMLRSLPRAMPPSVAVALDCGSRAPSQMFTRNSSGGEIVNVNFLYDDIVHALQNTIESCINSATDRRGYVLERTFAKLSQITQCYLLRHSRSFKVTDFGTSYLAPFPSYG